MLIDDFYNEYIYSSTAVIDTWIISAKNMLWNVLLLLLYIIICWLLFKLITNTLDKFLKLLKVDKLNNLYQKIDILNNFNLKIDFKKIIITLIKCFLLLIFVIIGADIFNLSGVTKVVNEIIAYLPRLITAIIIILVGIYVANQVKIRIHNFLTVFSSNIVTTIITNVLVFGIVLFFTLMGLNQANIDTTLFTNNISIILGVIFASVALSFGLGSKDIVKEILYSYYLRKSLQIGDEIKIGTDNVQGTLISIDNINVKIATSTGIVLYPIKKMVALKLEIINN